MPILNITTDQVFLQKVSKPVDFTDGAAVKRLGELLDDMHETLELKQGVGLAAVQVGVLWRAAIVDSCTDDGIIELVNPEIIKETNIKCGEEMCLSLPNVALQISRPTRVTVRAYDRAGKPFVYKFSGLGAICAGHEIDHLNGVTIIRRAEIQGEQK
jgi:peptide deformylase